MQLTGTGKKYCPAFGFMKKNNIEGLALIRRRTYPIPGPDSGADPDPKTALTPVTG
jgi:hypothetical protein